MTSESSPLSYLEQLDPLYCQRSLEDDDLKPPIVQHNDGVSTWAKRKALGFFDGAAKRCPSLPLVDRRGGETAGEHFTPRSVTAFRSASISASERGGSDGSIACWNPRKPPAVAVLGEIEGVRRMNEISFRDCDQFNRQRNLIREAQIRSETKRTIDPRLPA